MSIEISYYFRHPERFPLEAFLDGLSTPADILKKVKGFLHEMLVEPDTREMRGEVLCGQVHAVGNYRVGAGTKIYGDVTIIGPVYIGRDCEIMPGAVIRPYTVIGDGCSVGHGSELKRAVMFGGAKVASLAFVGDSVLGASARVGSGVITANRKFDQSNVTIKMGGVRHDLGDTYFGVVLGDFARLGANAVTQPGTHIGPYTWVYPMTAVRGFIPAQKRVFEKRAVEMEDAEAVELKP